LIKDYLKNNHYTNYTIINSGDVDILDRLKDCEKHINDDFMVCYGDTIADINLLQLKEFHANHKKAATMCLYSLNSNFGIIKRNKSGLVTSFKEKKKNYQYINIGYFIFKKNIFDQIHSAKNWMNFLESLIRKEQLFSFLHRGIHITVNTMTELKIAEKKIKQYNFNLKDKGQV
jgi:glucose-1-phosphate cytidylyltransferase